MSMVNVKQILWQLFTSRKVSTYLLIALTFLLVFTSFLPNPAYVTAAQFRSLQSEHPVLLAIGTKFNSQKLATGYFFGALAIFLVVSATVCSIDRILGRRRGQKESGSAEAAGELVATVSLPPGVGVSAVAGFVAEWVRRRLLGIEVAPYQPEGLVVARRGRFGFWGSLVFHSGLISALLALAVYSVGATRGRLVFTEGQRYQLTPANFRYLEKQPLWGLRLPDVGLQLLEQHSLFAVEDPNTAVEHVARFKVTDKNEASTVRDVKINVPLRLDGKDFLLTSGGFSPRFTVAGPDGGTVFDSFVNLKNERGTTDDFSVGSGNLHVDVRLYPEFHQEKWGPATKSLLLKNPFLDLTITRGGRVISHGIVAMGATVEASGYRISVPEVRHWAELEMAYEPGLALFFVVAFLGTLGLLVRMFDPEEQLTVQVHSGEESTIVEFMAHSRHFSALLKEVANDCSAAVVCFYDSRDPDYDDQNK